jgi:uncharacterized membrane protein
MRCGSDTLVLSALVLSALNDKLPAMNTNIILGLVGRWAHIIAAVTAIGGLIFMRLVLLPAAREALSDGERQRMHVCVMNRWRRIVNMAIGLLVISGFYNFFTIGMEKSQDAPTYSMMFGIKFLIALTVFFITSALVGKAKAFDSMRAKSAKWMTINVVLGILVILISGWLKSQG